MKNYSQPIRNIGNVLPMKNESDQREQDLAGDKKGSRSMDAATISFLVLQVLFFVNGTRKHCFVKQKQPYGCQQQLFLFRRNPSRLMCSQKWSSGVAWMSRPLLFYFILFLQVLFIDKLLTSTTNLSAECNCGSMLQSDLKKAITRVPIIFKIRMPSQFSTPDFIF